MQFPHLLHALISYSYLSLNHRASRQCTTVHHLYLSNSFLQYSTNLQPLLTVDAAG